MNRHLHEDCVQFLKEWERDKERHFILKLNSHTIESSEDETHDLLRTYKTHPGTIQFELAEGMNTSLYLDSERSHRKSTCIKYNKSFSKSEGRGGFFCVLVIISVPRTDACTPIQRKTGHLFSESSDTLAIHISYHINFLKPAKGFFNIFSGADREHMPLAHFRGIIFSKMKKKPNKPTQNLWGFF